MSDAAGTPDQSANQGGAPTNSAAGAAKPFDQPKPTHTGTHAIGLMSAPLFLFDISVYRTPQGLIYVAEDHGSSAPKGAGASTNPYRGEMEAYLPGVMRSMEQFIEQMTTGSVAMLYHFTDLAGEEHWFQQVSGMTLEPSPANQAAVKRIMQDAQASGANPQQKLQEAIAAHEVAMVKSMRMVPISPDELRALFSAQVSLPGKVVRDMGFGADVPAAPRTVAGAVRPMASFQRGASFGGGFDGLD